MRKLVCIDVDGTLIRNEYKIDDDIRAKMNEFKDDTDFLIVSGRTVKEISELNAGCDSIGSNGGEIFKNNELIKDAYIEYETAQGVINYLQEKDNICVVHTGAGRFIKKNTDVLSEMIKIARFRSELGEEIYDTATFMYSHVYGKSIKVEDVYQHVIENQLSVKKIETFYQGDKDEMIAELMDNYDVDSFSSAVTNVEIVPKGATKASAIKEYIGNDEYKVYAIGDGDNDISMFEIADTAIAMGNGTNTIKSMADYIVGTNRENGFIEALDIILNDKIQH